MQMTTNGILDQHPHNDLGPDGNSFDGADLFGHGEDHDVEPCQPVRSGLGGHVDVGGLLDPTVPGDPMVDGRATVPAKPQDPSQRDEWVQLFAEISLLEYEYLLHRALHGLFGPAGVAKAMLRAEKRTPKAQRKARIQRDWHLKYAGSMERLALNEPINYHHTSRPRPEAASLPRMVKGSRALRLKWVQKRQEQALDGGTLAGLFWEPTASYQGRGGTEEALYPCSQDPVLPPLFPPRERDPPPTPLEVNGELASLFWLPGRSYAGPPPRPRNPPPVPFEVNGELAELFWLPEHTYAGSLDNWFELDGELESLFWLPEHDYTLCREPEVAVSFQGVSRPGGMIGRSFPNLWPELDDDEDPTMLWSPDGGGVHDGCGILEEKAPSRLDRLVWRLNGLWWDTSLEKEQILFTPGDFLYSQISGLSLTEPGEFNNGAMDLRVVTSIVGGGYRHKLGPVIIAKESPGRVWVIRQILDGKRPLLSMPNIHLFGFLERQLTSYSLKCNRQRLEYYLGLLQGKGKTLIRSKWDLVISFTSVPLVAHMRLLRDAAVKGEDCSSCPLEARERLEVAYAALVADRPSRPVFTL